MIESVYRKEDLLSCYEKFKPVSKPPRWTERLQVNFEKEVTISFFMIRKLIESTKLSTKTTKYQVHVFRSPCIEKINNRNFWDIGKLYDLEIEETVSKNINFICNQFIHGGAMYAYRKEDRNWGGIYTCSDFERQKYVYRIPINEIINILKIAGDDYPKITSMIYDESTKDYFIKSD